MRCSKYVTHMNYIIRTYVSGMNSLTSLTKSYLSIESSLMFKKVKTCTISVTQLTSINKNRPQRTKMQTVKLFYIQFGQYSNV